MKINIFISSFNYLNALQVKLVDSVAQQKQDTIQQEISAYPIEKGEYILSSKEFWLAIAVLVVMISVLLFEVNFFKNNKVEHELATRLIIVTLVIMGSLFVIMAGYSDTQIAPIFALFGTIVGYLFGKKSNKDTIQNK